MAEQMDLVRIEGGEIFLGEKRFCRQTCAGRGHYCDSPIHDQRIIRTAISPNRQYLVSICEGGVVRATNFKAEDPRDTGKHVITIASKTLEKTSIVINDDGYVFIAEGCELRMRKPNPYYWNQNSEFTTTTSEPIIELRLIGWQIIAVHANGTESLPTFDG